MELLLIISITIIIHGYGGYILPILVSQIFKNRKSNTSLTEKKLHKICIVIAAYNEVSFIEKKNRKIYSLFLTVRCSILFSNFSPLKIRCTNIPGMCI